MNKDVDVEAKQVEAEVELQEDRLLAVEELVPITQTLITPTLACFFNLIHKPEPEPERKELLEQEEADLLAARALPGQQLAHRRLALAFPEVDADSPQLRLPQSDQKLKFSIDPPRAPPPPTGEGRSNGNFVTASECVIAAVATGGTEPEDSGEVQKTGQNGGRKHDFIMALEAGRAPTPTSCKRPINGFDYSQDDGIDDREGYGMNQAERENSSNSGDGGGSGGGGGSARTLKRPRLVWTPQLHKRFVDAVSHLGIKNAVPKTIMQLMNVEGLTRENVASHLQKYRLYLRRVQQGNLFSTSTSSSMLNPDQLMGSVSPNSDHLFSNSIPSIRAQADHQHHHHHPQNHIIPQHMSLILQQPHHHLQAPMVSSPPPFNNSHFNPHLYNALAANSSPPQRSLRPSPHVHMDHPHQPYHVDSQTTPASPPRRALTLFPH